MKLRICKSTSQDGLRTRGIHARWILGRPCSRRNVGTGKARVCERLITRTRVICAAAVLALTALVPDAAAAPIKFTARSREAAGPNEAQSVVYKEVEWESTRTAVIVCDMWDKHWCKGATARVAEMAPRMNEFLKKCRAMGTLVIHAPSGTMAFYKDYPQRKRAEKAKGSASGENLNSWKPLDRSQEGPLPIDDSDGGCDDNPKCAQGSPWRSQIDLLEIGEEDAVSDSGQEILGLMQERGIENVILLGVHANMCVLGRPFGIRAMVGCGKNVLLVRDLTDTMYSSQMRPFVSHFAGTDLVIEHIEKHWCPTITSDQMVGGRPFRFSADPRPTVAMVIAESEYHTWETLPAFATDTLLKAGLRIEYVTATMRNDDCQFRGYRALDGAGLVLVSARRRAMPHEMAVMLKQHVESGKPIVGIRTASHAFSVRGPDRSKLGQAGFEDWPEFDSEVLGGNYSGHHPAGPVTTVRVVPEALDHPVLKGVPLGAWSSPASLYKTSPLKPGATVLLTGQIAGEQAEPIAWVRSAGARQSRVFYTSLGHPEDFRNPSFRRMLANGILWALGMPTKGN
ncbi:MAG: ThuA domain-containing protein [Verrucomicrobiota bacterium]|nr:ThuA domain-containing protein [Verrucomicrobiota bacterium]